MMIIHILRHFYRFSFGFSVLFYCICFANPVFAQKAVPGKPSASRPSGADTALFNLFDPNVRLQWMHYYRGRFDDITPVVLALANDGNVCRGYLTFTRSNTRIRLEGKADSVSFRLQERYGGQTTGILAGQFLPNRLLAEWSSTDHATGSRLEAQQLPGPPTGPAEPCGENKWARRYIAKWNGARADMVLMRIYNGELIGYLWLESEDKLLNFVGNSTPEGGIQGQLIFPNGKIGAQIQGKVLMPQLLEFTWMGSGELRDFKFTGRENAPLGCLDYADFSSSMDALYPRINCDNCNKWLDDQIKRWTEKVKGAIAEKKPTAIPYNRNAFRASAWSEIACWTENIFSGYVTMTETWSDQIQGVAYNFDLRTGKEISLNDVFNKSFNAKVWFADYAKKEMPKLPVFVQDPKYREWVDKEGFPLMTFRRTGVELSTVFHPYYGRQKILIPYSVLKPFLKPGNPISDLSK